MSVDRRYMDPGLSSPERAEILLGQMSLEEKIAQLGSAWSHKILSGSEVAPSAQESLKHGLGQVTRISGASGRGAVDAAIAANEIQRFLVENTRLGIPAIVHEEICSGLTARDSVVFPQAINLAATWDPQLVEAMSDSIRTEMRAMGAHQGLSPVLDVCRDPRWGRLEETFGEDPYLAARMGVAFVRGLQGPEISEGVIATAKHFVGYGASEGGLNWAPAHIGGRELRDVYLYPFEAAVKEAGLRSVMNGYHELDGVPCGANRELLVGVLREHWGFSGLVVSDYFSVRQLFEYHHLAADDVEATAIGINSGIDVELPGTDCYGEPLLSAVESGMVTTQRIDEAVLRVLLTKFDLGIFENPFVEIGEVVPTIGRGSQIRLAGDLARKSLVLLANDGVLPLKGDEKIALIGPNADTVRNLLGDYSYASHIESLREIRDSENVFGIPVPDHRDLQSTDLDAVTIKAALEAQLGDRVRFAPGCDIDSDSTEGFEEAVWLAADSDLVVMVMGDKAGLTDGCTTGEGRDRSTLGLPGVQEDLVRSVLAVGKPLILVLVAGRPCGSEFIHRNASAVLMAWLPGQQGAEAVADALVGKANPGGKLPISFPRSVGQIPVFYGHKASGGRSHWKGDYVDGETTPLYAFGHGIGYSQIVISNPAVAQKEVGPDEVAEITCEVSNRGSRTGDEVVQLYLRDPVASVTRPLKELKAFLRVRLAPGETKTVVFEIPAGHLGFHDRRLEHVVEPGMIEVFVGSASDQLILAGSFSVKSKATGERRVFEGRAEIK